MAESLPQGSATYVAENNSWKLIVWPNPGRGWFRSVSGPLLPVLLAASATGGSISLELSLDTNKLWKRSFGDTLETHWGLRYPLASRQREKFNTPHTKIASESVQCEISCQILSKDRKAQFLYLCARFRVVWSDSNCPRCAIGPTSSSRNSAKISEDSSTELTRAPYRNCAGGLWAFPESLWFNQSNLSTRQYFMTSLLDVSTTISLSILHLGGLMSNMVTEEFSDAPRQTMGGDFHFLKAGTVARCYIYN